MLKKILLLWLIIFIFGGAKFLVATDDFPTLNAPLLRDFKAGDVHKYKILAQKGEFFEIACRKKDVAVSLTLFSPNQTKIIKANFSPDWNGTEKLYFTPDESGEYTVEISASRPAEMRGSYTLDLQKKRLASEQDRMRAAAMKLLSEARELVQGYEKRIERAKIALPKFEQAAELFEQADDFSAQAVSLFYLGYTIATEFGDEGKAVVEYERALEIIRQNADKTLEAFILTDAGRDYWSLGNKEKAIAYLNRALVLQEELKNKRGKGFPLAYLCRTFNDTAQFQKALETCRQASGESGEKDLLKEQYLFNLLGNIYANTGDDENAEKNYQAALQIIPAVKLFISPVREATVKGNLGGIFLRQKKYPEAAKLFEDAFKISETVERPLYASLYLRHLGEIYLALGEPEKALPYIEKSLALYRQFGDRFILQVALNVAGKIAAALNRQNEARAYLVEALDLMREKKDRYAEAETLYNLAEIENRFGNGEISLEYIRQATAISEFIRADLLGANSRTTFISGILKKYYELEINVLIGLAEKNPTGNYLEQAWQVQEKIRARALLENFLESGVKLSEIVPPEFFVREKSLLERIANAEIKRAEASKAKKDTKQEETNLQNYLADYAVLQEDFRRANPNFSALNQPKTFTFADAQSFLDAETAIIEYNLGEKQSFVWIIRQKSVTLHKLSPRATINRAASDFYLSLAGETSADSGAPNFTEQANRLSKEILAPFADKLSDTKRLIIIADGALQNVPFSTLTLSPNDKILIPLIASKEIINAPAFASLAYLRERQKNRQKSADKVLAVFADPIFNADDERLNAKNKPRPNLKNQPQKNENLSKTLRDFGLDRLPRLPFSGLEAREIAKFAPGKSIIETGFKASRENFLRGDFAEYRILHFATHGFLNVRNPDLSGLVLSLYDEKSAPQNGFLRMIDLSPMRLNADLVVLSACQTGLGKEIDGEGVIGLTRGFIYAGASGVVASLWKVEDAATAELMKRFYRAMLQENQTPAAALRIAQNEMRQIPRFSNPRNWAGFTLTGEGK